MACFFSSWISVTRKNDNDLYASSLRKHSCLFICGNFTTTLLALLVGCSVIDLSLDYHFDLLPTFGVCLLHFIAIVEENRRCRTNRKMRRFLLSNQELCGDFVAYNFHFLIRLESRKLCERLHIMSRLRFTRLRCTFAPRKHGVGRRIACVQLRCMYVMCNLLFMCINRIVKLHRIKAKYFGGQEM